MDLQIDYRIAPQMVVVAFVASKCDRTKGVALEEKKIAKCGVTDANSILQHGLKYRLKLARRRTNYTQHLRGRRLLLQRFGKLARALLLGLEQPHVLDRNHGLISKRGD